MTAGEGDDDAFAALFTGAPVETVLGGRAAGAFSEALSWLTTGDREGAVKRRRG